MFNRIKSTFSRQPSYTDEWGSLRDAGYHDVPRYFDNSHGRGGIDRERERLQPFGHLR